MLVCLKSLVMMRVSLPVYVNFAYFVVVRLGLSSWFCCFLLCLMLKGVLYLFVCRICLMILFSFCFSSSVVIYISHSCYTSILV
jgi:hypothetical protein